MAPRALGRYLVIHLRSSALPPLSAPPPALLFLFSVPPERRSRMAKLLRSQLAELVISPLCPVNHLCLLYLLVSAFSISIAPPFAEPSTLSVSSSGCLSGMMAKGRGHTGEGCCYQNRSHFPSEAPGISLLSPPWRQPGLGHLA